ncbi:MAG: NH(3)-dependent NAD(+) synthetase [Turneriella sp.]|nr:NH(3)-dependent NAD(+) synthetase [Turneriella sp.]
MPQLPEFDTVTCAKNLVTNLKGMFQKLGFSRTVLGLSGGVDSALSLRLALEALGRENVLAVIMPYKTGNPNSEKDARELCEKFNVTYEVHSITPMADAYFATDTNINAARKGNVMARLRMVILYDLSARNSALVLGTSNRTETLLGYATMWGDMACALNPLGNLFKYQVYSLAQYFGVTEAILKKAPSADLWTGQSDEGELGFTYAIADLVLYYYSEKKYSRAQLENLVVEHGEDAGVVEKILSRIEKFAYKRSMPPIVPL